MAASDATLARLSFWVRPERLAEFEGVYQKRLLPLLRPHGLEEFRERGRPTVAAVFSRLFALDRPAAVEGYRRGLGKDPGWQEALRSLAKDFGNGDALSYHWGIYRSPAGPGRTVVAGPGYRKGAWRSFGIGDGLPSSAVHLLFRDHSGNLWAATVEAGVCCYDGAQFATYTTEDGLPDNVVTALAEDRGGRLWIGTEKGVSRCDGELLVTFTTEDGLAHNQVFCIAEDREGSLWFGTWGGGVSRYDGERFVTYTTREGLGDNYIRTIMEDGEGNMWLGTRESGVSRYDGQEFVTFTTEDGLANNGGVRAIVEDQEGNLWFATQGGLSRRARQTGRSVELVSFTTADGLSHNAVGALLVDSAGHLWAGTHLGGVSWYDGRRFTNFTTRDGLSSPTVLGLAEDRLGQIWCCTWGGGLCRYEGQHLATVTSGDELAGDGVLCLAEDRAGHLWCGTWGGVSRYDGEKFTSFTTEHGLVSNVVWTILEDRNGYLWFGTPTADEPSGASRYDGSEFVSFTTKEGLADNNVRRIVEDREGLLWFGTDGGVSRYDGEKFVNFTTENGLIHQGVTAILEDRHGFLWFGTEGGVSRFDSKEFVNYTTEEGLVHNRVTALLEDRNGYLWFGTHGGVSRYDGEAFVSYTTAEGLSYNAVLSLYEDREGYLWFGTWGGGVSRYDGQVFQRLDRQDGLAHDVVHCVLQDRHGDIWIATEGGLTRCRPQHLSPTTSITEVVTDRPLGPVAQVELPASQKRLAFEFQGRSWTTRPDRMAYVYRLQGYREEWQVAYQQRMDYQDLPVGEYLFQVKAVDRDLNYSPEPAQVLVSVVPDPLVEALTAAFSPQGRGEEFVGTSTALHEVQRQLSQVMDTDLALLILGETGTGKGLAARLVHGASARQRGPFITVSCGALPERLVESELFGHEKGAFTGAHSRKLGKVDLAKGGTLFLDEIGDSPLEAQGKLLRLLEEYTFERVGGTQTLSADVRVIAATNRELARLPHLEAPKRPFPRHPCF
jgi:ligand-binding sensor domain-containing protein